MMACCLTDFSCRLQRQWKPSKHHCIGTRRWTADRLIIISGHRELHATLGINVDNQRTQV